MSTGPGTPADDPRSLGSRSPEVVPPYGPPIFRAIERGELHEMKAVAHAAREALYGVKFEPVTPENEGEVRAALEQLETAIAKLER